MVENKIRLDDIVLPESFEVARQFECAVCLNFAQGTVVQTPCGHVYCKECLEPCSLCPQCREPFEALAVRPLKEVNKMGMRMMQGIKVQCPHGKQQAVSAESSIPTDVGAAEGEDVAPHAAKRPRLELEKAVALNVCTWKGSYGDLLSKHLCDCPLHPIPCPQGCGQVLPRGEMASHRLSCERSFEDCWICGDRVPIGGMSAHNEEKAMVHVDLLAAKLHACEAAASEQTSLSLRLARVEEQLKGRAATAHVSTVAKTRAEEVKAHVTARLVKHAEWEVKRVKQLLTSKKVGEHISSSTFGLGGIDGFHMRFYPHGDTGKDKPHITIQNDPGNIDAKVSLHALDQRTAEDTNWEPHCLRLDLPPEKLADIEVFTVHARLVSGGLKIKV